MVPPVLSRVSLKYLWCSQHGENSEQKKPKGIPKSGSTVILKLLMNLKAQEEKEKH